MRDEKDLYPWKGFLLLPYGDADGYMGIDRKPFVPTLVEEEFEPPAPVREDETRISRFYPPGWRRDAYQIYEDNLVENTGESLDLLSVLDAAQRISEIIDSHVGKHEIFYCEIWSEKELQSPSIEFDDGLFGIDIAYPGGDFYSAIFNGLFLNPSPQLEEEFKGTLNDRGLFKELDQIPGYLQRFREAVDTEKDSEFVIYLLSKVEA